MTHRILRPMAAGLLFALAACDVPTGPGDLPAWDVTLRIPRISGDVSIDEFMPTGVTVVNGEFAFDALAYNGNVSAADKCAPCTLFPGTPGYYPAFDHAETFSVALGGGFQNAVLTGGSLDLSVTHDLPYTVLRSDDGTIGFVAVELVRSTDGTVLASDTVTGAQNPFGPGASSAIMLSLPLQNVNVTPDMELRFSMESPGSGTDSTRTLDPAASLDYSAQIRGVRAQGVTMTRDSTSFTADPMDFEISEDTRAELEGPISRALVSVTLDQPFELTGAFTVGFYTDSASAYAGTSPVVEESVAFGTGETVATIEITQTQMQALLSGPGIFVKYSGDFSGGDFYVRATDRVRYEAGMDVDLTINRKE